MAAVRAHLEITGRVQGVFFRDSTRHEARRLGLTGWVRNLPRGSVEAVFEGEEAKVEEMIRWCHKGPPGAMVREVRVERGPARDEFDSFRVTF